MIARVVVVVVFPPEPPVAISAQPERSGGRKGARVLRGEANPCARAPFWHLRSSTGGVAGTRRFPLVSSEHGGLVTPATARFHGHIVSCCFTSQRARECLTASVPARAQNQTSMCGLGRIGLHRRLSLDLPASLETQDWEPRKVAFLRSVPEWRGLAGRANCASQYSISGHRSGGLFFADLGRGFAEALFSPIHRHQVSHELPRHGERGLVAIPLLLLSLIHQRQFRIPARRQFRCFD